MSCKNSTLRLNYFLIPAITVLVSTLGGYFTSYGMVWHKTLNLPSYIPPYITFSIAWTTIFILTTVAALIVWNSFQRNLRFWMIMGFFAINALLNVLWTYLFFYNHLIGVAALEAALLYFSIIILMLLIWPISYLTALLLLPYLGWMTFATYLNYVIWMIN